MMKAGTRLTVTNPKLVPYKTMTTKKTNLKSLTREEAESFMKNAGFPAFRARQLIRWIYEHRVQSIDQITEFSKEMREKLSEQAYISNIELAERKIALDKTEKYLFKLKDGETIESVLIENEERHTLCISTQAGCSTGCEFCLTGKLGLKRNLKPHEIVDQVISVNRLIQPIQITNIVLMGMGEPLANAEAVIEALWRMTDFMKLAPRRITVSTAGVVPGIKLLGEKGPQIMLAISLNATTNEVRDKIMPVNKKWPIEELMDACRKFPLQPRRRIIFEYVLLRGINDTPADAKRLVRLLHGIRSKINLIPFNPFEGCEYERPDEESVLEFQQILMDAQLTAMIRKSKGMDILAACGQLKANYEN
jgi:23S rRNA (adenine2503-C2)-methyltransferase